MLLQNNSLRFRSISGKFLNIAICFIFKNPTVCDDVPKQASNGEQNGLLILCSNEFVKSKFAKLKFLDDLCHKIDPYLHLV